MTTKKYLFLILLSIILALTSCTSGYQKENDKWTWISYNEAVGKNTQIIKKADTKTFIILENIKYAKDKNFVFLEGKAIKFADPKTFEIISNNGYSKDNKNVYLDCNIIINADPNTFKALDWPYSKDKKHIFCGNLPINITNPNEFKVTRTGSGKTFTNKSFFIKQNPNYKWLDSIKTNIIITGGGSGQTKTEKFVGYKKK